MPHWFVKVVDFRAAEKPERIIEVPEGSKDPRPQPQNVAVLKKSKGGGLVTVPVGNLVLAIGQKLKLVTRGEKVFLEKR